MMSEDTDSKQQELPPWTSQEPTLAGPNQAARSSNPQPAMEAATTKNDGCCTKCIGKCGPLGWYFSPMCDKLGYSLLTTFYHLVMFAFTLATMNIVITLFSVSVGLLVLIFGFILFWWTCEISVVLARIDLALSYYMVEDNRDVIKNRSRSLKLNLYKRIAPCPCSSRVRSQGVSCCSALGSRMKSLALRWDMYKIFLFQMLFKPLIVGLTCWIFIVVGYVTASIFIPVVWLIDEKVFTDGYWCPYNGSSCEDTCECVWISVDNFGEALAVGIVSLLLLPLVLHVSIWFAKGSKIMSYYWLSNYYTTDMDGETGKLLFSSNDNSSATVRDDSVSTDNHNVTQQSQIVHSINNPYVDHVQV